MAVPESAAEVLRWALTILLPLLLAVLLTLRHPDAGMTRPTLCWLRGLQVVGLVLVLVGVITPLALFPIMIVLMFCTIFSGLLHILSQFAASFSCPELPLAAQAHVLIQPGLAILVFATALRLLSKRNHLKGKLPGKIGLEPKQQNNPGE